MNPWVLGAIIAAGAALLGGAAIVIHIQKLKIDDLRRELFKAKAELLILKSIMKGEENYKVNVGLYDEDGNEVKEIEYKAEKIGFGIREGLTIHA